MRLLVGLTCVAACGTDSPPCINERRTIEQGVYGAARYVATDRVANDEPLKGVDITINHVSENDSADVVTDGDGFYEQSLPLGSYVLISDFAMVAPYPFAVDPTHPVIRLDLVVDEGLVAQWQYQPVDICR